MKRHPSLAHLSRDHHGALLLARLLQKNAPVYNDLPADTTGKAAYALTFYNAELIQHFDKEEKVLQLVTGIHSAIDLMITIILREHQELHLQFAAIAGHPALANHLDALGSALEAHIRREERELFPAIQDHCDDALMTAIDQSLTG